MAFSLSPIGNEQQANSNGAPLSGGLLYTYLAGSTTPAPTYTDSTGTTPQANPVVLNTLGRPADPIWLTDGVAYKLVLTSSVGAAQWTIDNITGVTNSTPVQDEWVLQSTVPTYINATQFSVPGDQTSTFTVGRRVRAVCTGGVRHGYISVSDYTSLTTITLVLDADTLDSGLSAVSVGLLSSVNSSMPWLKSSATGLTAQGALAVAGALSITGTTTLSGNATLALQAVTKQQLDVVSAAAVASVVPATIAPTLNVLSASQTMSGETEILFSGIPSWVTCIRGSIVSASIADTAVPVITIGDAGGLETSGYVGAVAGGSTGASPVVSNLSAAFQLKQSSLAAQVWHSQFMILKEGGNRWSFQSMTMNETGVWNIAGGSKTLSDTMTQLQIGVSGGAGGYDAGTCSIMWS